ncbi:MAG TPA: 3-phosphoshikimate 1-carboxyvinyltransferase [Firmicutes bacterium]|nr:3-phosphoshikimate 1-carboxyvinyltransferase [Bacillota bacterium]
MKLFVEAKGALRGEITVPGDKSVSHRAAILGALAEGETVICGFLPGEDCLATLRCLRQLGVEIAADGSEVRIKGAGLYGLAEPDNVLDCGNSGTTARLLLGVLAGQPFFSVLTGDASLCGRPMGRVTGPLQEMGARFWGREGGNLLPLAVQGGTLTAVTYRTPVASAQLKSALLLAGLFARGETVVTEPEQSRDHTERMLAAFGAEVAASGTTVRLVGRPKLTGQVIDVPGDISSAAFFLVAAAIVPGSEVLVRNVGVNPSRTGILDVLQQMGARVELLNPRSAGGEPVADILVRPGELRGVEIGGPLIPRLIDELPVLAVAALFAAGRTVVRDARELRVKETDRIAAVAEELAKIGGVVTTTEDGFVIEGGRQLAGGTADSRHDHRMAMALAVAGLRAKAPVCIDNAECMDVSFPAFAATLARLQG